MHTAKNNATHLYKYDPRRLTHAFSGDPHSKKKKAFLQATIFCVSLPAPLTIHTVSYKSHLPQRLLQPQRSSLSLAAILARSALLALLHEVTFAPSDLRTLGSSSTLGNKYSFCPLGSRRCSNNSAVAHSETFALTSNPTLSVLVICTSTFVLSCFSCVHSWALPPTGGQWIPPLPPNVTYRASACIWHQNKDQSTNKYNKIPNLGT